MVNNYTFDLVLDKAILFVDCDPVLEILWSVMILKWLSISVRLERDLKAETMIGGTSDGMEASSNNMPRKREITKSTSNLNSYQKDSLKLKRPESAYFLFMNERHDALVAESKSQVEIAKLTREEWKNMTKNQKASYEIVAKQNKKYTQEIEVYKQNKREDELLQVLKQEALQLLKKREN
ncbi:high mobility group B protein 6-like protein [Tanacetum coccineum]